MAWQDLLGIALNVTIYPEPLPSSPLVPTFARNLTHSWQHMALLVDIKSRMCLAEKQSPPPNFWRDLWLSSNLESLVVVAPEDSAMT